MPELVDMRVVGLLCSHLCHELVNPLGAVNNGIELLMDVGDDMRDDALGLIESSAARTTHRVMFYRVAYGMAGVTTLPDLNSVRKQADDALAEGRISLEWPDAGRNPPLEQGWGRMLLNMAATAVGALPRGGVLVVKVDESGARLSVTARGDTAEFDEATRIVFADDVAVEALTPRNIQAYFTVSLARDSGYALEVSVIGDGEVELAVSVNG